MILHFEHIRFTDGRTFIVAPFCLLVAVDDSPTFEIVGRELYQDLVAGKNADEVLAHLSRNVREHLVAVLQIPQPKRPIISVVRRDVEERAHQIERVVLGQAITPRDRAHAGRLT